MVQFNLLPDVKLEYIKAERTKRFVTFVSMIIGVIALGLLFLSMIIVYVVQKQMIRSLDSTIQQSNQKLSSIKDVDKILTVQNQLSTLTSLHESKPAVSRVFSYVQQTTPSKVNLNKLSLDFATSSITLGGTASSLDDVKNYADALKAATYVVADGPSQKAFSDVVLTSFSKNDKDTTFTITSKFASDLFDITKDVKLSTSSAGANNSVFQGGH